VTASRGEVVVRRFRRRAIASCFLAALLFGALPAVSGAAAPENSWDGVARVLAVGDVHGDYDQFLAVLRAGGVVDAKGRWSGGKTHLVQTGDRVDRGPDSRKVMDFLMRLEKEARKAGGRVHALVGNHEAMNVLGELRYVTPEEFAAFRTPGSEQLRAQAWERIRAQREEQGLPAGDDERTRFEAEHPPGWIEHRRAFLPEGRYGKWIGEQNAVVRIGETLFLHGGIAPKYADFALPDLNERVRAEIRGADPQNAVLVQDPDGPLWFRGLAREDAALVPHLDAVLQRHGCRRMVLGHTTTEGLVMPLYGGRVVLIDVGLSRAYWSAPAALLLEGGRAFALHRGRKLPLPDGGGEPLLRYVREVVALEPEPARIRGLLERLEAALSAAPAR
jgi:hypothetical protein